MKAFPCMGCACGWGAEAEAPSQQWRGMLTTVSLPAGWMVLRQCHRVCGMMDAFLKRVQSEGIGKVCVWEGLEGQCREIRQHLLMPKWEEYVDKGSVEKRPCMCSETGTENAGSEKAKQETDRWEINLHGVFSLR